MEWRSPLGVRVFQEAIAYLLLANQIAIHECFIQTSLGRLLEVKIF